MSSNLKSWQRTAIRNNMANYRRAQENYAVLNKQVIELENGYKAFSLVSPPHRFPCSPQEDQTYHGGQHPAGSGR